MIITSYCIRSLCKLQIFNAQTFQGKLCRTHTNAFHPSEMFAFGVREVAGNNLWYYQYVLGPTQKTMLNFMNYRATGRPDTNLQLELKVYIFHVIYCSFINWKIQT